MLHRPARLRRQFEAARRRRSLRLLVPLHGAGPGRGDGVARLRHVQRRRSRPRRARAAPDVPRPSGEGAQGAAFMDMLPQHYLLNNVTRQWGKFSWHWFFMMQPYPTPEKMMGADPEFFIRRKLSKTDQGTALLRPGSARRLHPLHQEPRSHPRHVRGLSRDLRHRPGYGYRRLRRRPQGRNPRADPVGREGRRRAQPQCGRSLATLRDQHRERPTVPSGHYLQEECPDETYDELSGFFRNMVQGQAAQAAE